MLQDCYFVCRLQARLFGIMKRRLELRLSLTEKWEDHKDMEQRKGKENKTVPLNLRNDEKEQ